VENIMRRLNWKYILIGLLVIIILAAGGFVVWASTPLGPMDEARAALQSDSQVQVKSENGWEAFQPTGTQPTTGFIYYPGGRVAWESYAPYVHAIAAGGYLAVLIPMPLNLAVFGADRATDVIKAYPQIQQWAVGGHSLGGAMAARYANTHPDRVQGLVLYASYPDTSNDLSEQKIAVVSIFGTSDGVATPNKVEGAKALLPADALFVPIEGGDHSQFGWYGLQPGDNPATISRQEQQTQAVNATLDLLAKLGSSGS
jgi:hypothetical protein